MRNGWKQFWQTRREFRADPLAREFYRLPWVESRADALTRARDIRSIVTTFDEWLRWARMFTDLGLNPAALPRVTLPDSPDI